MKQYFFQPKQAVLLALIVFCLAFSLAACTAIPADTSLNSTRVPTLSPTETPGVQATQPAAQKFTIGFSNTQTGSDFRKQMLTDLLLVSDEYKANGYINDLVLESADTDAAGQVKQIQNLIDKKVNAILVFPADPTGLKDILQQAVSQGILVIAVGSEVDLPGVYNVGIDQNERTAAIIKRFAEKLGSDSEIATLNTTTPNFREVVRQADSQQLLAKYPGIKNMGQAESKLDAEASREAALSLLNQYPNIKGMLVSEGLALGVLQAITETRPNNPPIITGDPSCYYLNLWNEYRKTFPEFDSVVLANPPGASAATGLRITVNLLLGKKIDPAKMGGPNGLNFIVPNLAEVTKEDFDQQYFLACMGKPASFIMDTIMTDEAVQAFFVK